MDSEGFFGLLGQIDTSKRWAWPCGVCGIELPYGKRLFQTMGEIATEQNSTIILPIPLDLFKPYLNSSSSPDGYGASAVQKKS
jgi:hypothetical protein